MKLLVALTFQFALGLAAPVVAESSGQSAPAAAICPLSDSQSRKAIDAFSTLASAITKEDRCMGCHGRVNPFIDGTGADPGNADAVPSQFEHGAGAVDRTSDCNECHSQMAHRTRDDSESKWMTAPDFLSFVGKDAPTICKQVRGILHNAKDFLGHLTDDNGGNNFAGTAFNGDRGLDRVLFPESEVPTRKPGVSHQQFLKLGKDWVDSMGGELQGSTDCGCEAVHYAIRVSVENKIGLGPVQHTSSMKPVEVPIVFSDDGIFTGDGAADFQGSGTAGQCSELTRSSLQFHVSGQAIETPDKQSMNLQFRNSSPPTTSFSAVCPVVGNIGKQGEQAGSVVLPFEFKGNLGETLDYKMPGIPGVDSNMRMEIIKK